MTINILTQYHAPRVGKLTASSAITSWTADPGLTVTAWPGDANSIYFYETTDTDSTYALSVFFGTDDEADFSVHILSSTEHGSYTQPQAFIVKAYATISYTGAIQP